LTQEVESLNSPIILKIEWYFKNLSVHTKPKNAKQKKKKQNKNQQNQQAQMAYKKN
jgi:hypothetical protein